MSIKRWDPQTTMNFVKMYGEHRCLWDKSIPDYKCRSTRDTAIEDIIARLGIENLRIEDIKCKIRIIRNAYINEKKKIREKKRLTADGERKDYVCTLNWFPLADSFLSKVVRKRAVPEIAFGPIYGDENEYRFVPIDDECSPRSSDHSSPKSLNQIDLENFVCRTDIVKIENIDDDDEDEDENELAENASEITEAYTLPEYVHSEEETNQSQWRHMNNNNVPDFVRDEPLAPSAGTISSRQTYVDDVVHGQNVPDDQNEFDLFARNIALQLNRLPLENALKVQKKIHDLLLAERLTVIRQNRGRENHS